MLLPRVRVGACALYSSVSTEAALPSAIAGPECCCYCGLNSPHVLKLESVPLTASLRHPVLTATAVASQLEHILLSC
jgi:hypothetical protein